MIGYVTKRDFWYPAPPINFGPIAHWSRGFLSNSRDFSLVESLHWTWDLAIATASHREMHQLPAPGLGTVHF